MARISEKVCKMLSLFVIGGIVAERTYPDALACGIEKPFWIAWDSEIAKVISYQNKQMQC